MNKTKTRIEGLNFVRLMCCLGVVAYHYSIHAMNGNYIFLKNANSAWGGIMVEIFFLLSGGLLYVNYSKIDHLFTYFKKRFLSIYPAFYIAFAFMFISTVFGRGQIFWSGSPKMLILSLTGLDGYLNCYFPSDYYILGEWFLGALIILYILYPVVAKLVNKFNLYFLIVYSLIYLGFLIVNPVSKMDPSQNMISCLMIFILGMYIMKYREYILNIKCLIPSIIIFLITVFCKIPLPADFVMKVCSISLFIILQQLGIVIEKTVLKKPINYLSGLTYEVFLLQHLIIVRMLLVKDYSSLAGSYFELLITTILIFIYAKGLQVLANHFKMFIQDTFALIEQKLISHS